MLRGKFWLHLKREPTQTFDSWVVTVKERAAECKFPADFYEQGVRDKLTFSCKEDNYKLKLYDEGAALSLEKAAKILSLKEATKRELQESKTAVIESVIPRGNRPDPHAGQDTEQRNQRDSKRKAFQTSGRNCGYCNRRHPPNANATKWDISLSYARVYLQKRSTKFSKLRMTVASHLWEGLLHPLVQILPRQNQQQTLKSVSPTLDGMSNSRFKTKTR